jgi:hypothetical protein
VARSKPFLKPEHIIKRLRWADDNSERDWKGVIFTDEASVRWGRREGYHGLSDDQGSNPFTNTSPQRSNKVAKAS